MDHFFPLAYDKEVDKICKGLGINRTGASRTNKGMALVPVLCQNRNTAQIQHIEDIGIAHLILQGESQNIKLGKGGIGFKGIKRDASLTHEPLHINPGRKNPFAVGILPLIQNMVEDFHA